MLRCANIPDHFYRFGPAGFHVPAATFIMEQLDDPIAARFLSVPNVGYEFSETTCAHVVRSTETAESIYNSVPQDAEKKEETLSRIRAMLFVHDIPDLAKEVITAIEETDPLKKEHFSKLLKQYEISLIPFAYRLAHQRAREGRKDIFLHEIKMLRDHLVTPDQYKRGFTPAEATAFCEKSLAYIAQRGKTLLLDDHHDSPMLRKEVDSLLAHYHDIENGASFEGLQAQIIEKCDGTYYACTISQKKNKEHRRPTHYHMQGHLLNRINARYEKNLQPLYGMAGDDPIKQALAIRTLQHCYTVSKTTVELTKPFFSLKQDSREPGFDDHDGIFTLFVENHKDDCDFMRRDTACALYQDALDRLKNEKIVTLPAPGKTLLDAPPVRIPLHEETQALLKTPFSVAF